MELLIYITAGLVGYILGKSAQKPLPTLKEIKRAIKPQRSAAGEYDTLQSLEERNRPNWAKEMIAQAKEWGREVWK